MNYEAIVNGVNVCELVIVIKTGVSVLNLIFGWITRWITAIITT